MMTRVAVIDYGTGNVHSVGQMLTDLSVQWDHTRDPAVLRDSTHLLMPGVGHCAQAMRSLVDTGTDRLLEELVLQRGVPVLGICLGMQLMTAASDEGDTRCLGWFDAATQRIRPVDRERFKVPNIGWHRVSLTIRDTRAFKGIALEDYPFYFCHAYSVQEAGAEDVSATFHYEASHVAAFERRNIVGVQFHPEKSQEAGIALMRNFLAMDPGNV